MRGHLVFLILHISVEYLPVRTAVSLDNVGNGRNCCFTPKRRLPDTLRCDYKAIECHFVTHTHTHTHTYTYTYTQTHTYTYTQIHRHTHTDTHTHTHTHTHLSLIHI